MVVMQNRYWTTQINLPLLRRDAIRDDCPTAMSMNLDRLNAIHRKVGLTSTSLVDLLDYLRDNTICTPVITESGEVVLQFESEADLLMFKLEFM